MLQDKTAVVRGTGRPSPPLPPPACSKMSCCYYQCVHCLSPVSSLYRQYDGGGGGGRSQNDDANSKATAAANPSNSSSSNSNSSSTTTLKLSVCQACGENVDPYVEREWLLVVLDMVLLREEAYRHVLLNNHRLVVDLDVLYHNPRSALQYMLASSILQAYLLWQALSSSSQDHVLIQHNRTNVSVSTGSNEDLESIAWDFSRLVFVSLLDHCVLAMTCFVVLIVCLLPQQQQQTAPLLLPLPLKTIIATRIYIGILLPTTFSFVTILALCWENTDTVRMLGGFLIRCFQIMALQTTALAALKAATTVASENDIVKKKKKKKDDYDDSMKQSRLSSSTSSTSATKTTFTAYFRLRAVAPVAIGMVTRIVIGAVVNAMIHEGGGGENGGIPCTGFMYDFHGTFVCLS